jgi:acyl carrier protein
MLEEELLDYISERARVERTALGADTPLFSNGFLDSIAVLEMTAFIERTSGVRFDVTEISLDNLDSVGRIMNFVKSKTAR